MDRTKEQVIRDIIGEVYHCCYVGKLKIKKLKPVGYELIIALDMEEKPIHIAAQLHWEDFLKFIRQELRDRHLHSASYYTGYKIDIVNDKRRINRENQWGYSRIGLS